jgi:hypothetical protein
MNIKEYAVTEISVQESNASLLKALALLLMGKVALTAIQHAKM